jgi:hypothetical protein
VTPPILQTNPSPIPTMAPIPLSCPPLLSGSQSQFPLRVCILVSSWEAFGEHAGRESQGATRATGRRHEVARLIDDGSRPRRAVGRARVDRVTFGGGSTSGCCAFQEPSRDATGATSRQPARVRSTTTGGSVSLGRVARELVGVVFRGVVRRRHAAGSGRRLGWQRARSADSLRSHVDNDRRVGVVAAQVVRELVGVIIRAWLDAGMSRIPGGISGSNARDQPTAREGQVDDDGRLGVVGAGWFASWSA